MRRSILFLAGLFSFSCLQAQEVMRSREYPQGYFRAPLDLPPVIAGSFGELRGNHFHSGLDYKTNQRVGYPVYAVADGYISRLRVQATGFGNAIYLTHPNGFTSVYGHLQRFNPRISQTIKTYQYRIESFEVDFPLLPIEIPVKKGEIIGWSGNSGSSGGPHLHFELRDTQTEETINPQLFGLTIPDRVKPLITGLYVYRLNGLPFSENTPRQFLPVTGAMGKYKLKTPGTVLLQGESGLGIMTYDKNSASANMLGVYSIQMKLDQKPVYTAVWERFFFQNTRAINAHLDYPVLISSGRKIQKSFIEPGNPLTLYKDEVNRGLLNINDNNIHTVDYIVTDVAGNTSTLSFSIKNASTPVSQAVAEGGTRFSADKLSTFEAPGIKVEVPPGVLYSDLDFSYATSPRPASAFSRIHHLHNRLIPVHNPYTLRLKPDVPMTENLMNKAVIVDTRGISQGGIAENGYIKTEMRSFGNFYLTVDTIAPRITPLNLTEGKSMTGVARIIFKISDNLSGIRSFRGTIDGKWVLMEFDAKSGTLWHTFDERTPPGTHAFQLELSDMKQNLTTFKANFSR